MIFQICLTCYSSCIFKPLALFSPMISVSPSRAGGPLVVGPVGSSSPFSLFKHPSRNDYIKLMDSKAQCVFFYIQTYESEPSAINIKQHL